MRIRRLLFVPAALLFAASAGAQKSPTAPSSHAPAATLPKGAAAAWTGTPSKWGGSPPQQSHEVQRGLRQPGVYIPIAVAAPYPVPAPVDTVYVPVASRAASAQPASVEMPVVTAHHEERQLTTIEVYRLQPRFQRP